MLDDGEMLMEELYTALRQLRNAAYRPPESLRSVLGCGPEADAAHVQSALVRCIVASKPGPDIPAGSRSKLLYDILNLRYVAGCTQEHTAEELGLSVRQVNRLQRDAVQQLAMAIVERRQRATESDQGAVAAEGESEGVTAPQRAEGWQAQLREDLLSLTERSDELTKDLREVVGSACALLRSVNPASAPELRGGVGERSLSVCVHPSVVRQIVVAVARQLFEVVGGALVCDISVDQRDALVTLSAQGQPGPEPMNLELPKELLRASGGSLSQVGTEAGVTVTLRLPVSRAGGARYTVLVIDDNEDLATLFDAYCTGSPYELVHIWAGADAPAALEEYRPDIILLDVMLPDMDGWELLRKLRSNPTSKDTPIIVCSVISDDALALALGASAFLRKPVWRQQMLEAFDRAIRQPGY